MWESRVLCEISKRLWKSLCDFHRRGISTAVSLDLVARFRVPIGGMLDPAPSSDRRSYGLLRLRFSS